MTEATWQFLTTAPNVPAGHAVASLLEANGVTCKLKADSSLLGEARSCAVLVEASLLHRAKWLLSEASFTDEELEFLATGQLGGDAASMGTAREHAIRRLGPDDVGTMDALLTVFGRAFGEVDTYGSNRPDQAYMRELLGSDGFFALVAMHEGQVIGGLAAYELKKFEQPRSELYIYDLAVAVGHRRKGVATSLIQRLGELASSRGTHVMFVQADRGDEAAIALYTKLGVREDVLHFDIPARRPVEAG